MGRGVILPVSMAVRVRAVGLMDAGVAVTSDAASVIRSGIR